MNKKEKQHQEKEVSDALSILDHSNNWDNSLDHYIKVIYIMNSISIIKK